MSTTDDPKVAPGEATAPTAPARPRMRTPPSRISELAELPPGFVLGKYRIVRALGAGGMGAVYEAEHVEIGKQVALKVLSAALAASPRARARFLREAASASRLHDRHVVNVTDYGADDGAVPYLVMELLRGEDLDAYLGRTPRGLPVAEIADIMLPVCAGVFAAHEAGVIHRDLKPSNIFLAQTSRRELEPKVLDFGISKADDGGESTSLTDPGAVLGTPHYMSPEQVAGDGADARSDQYALGVVLYECVTGHRPHEGPTSFVILRSIAEGSFIPPSRFRPDLPPALEAVIMRAMERDPAARFASVHALGAALLPFASDVKRLNWADYYGRPPGPPIAGPEFFEAANRSADSYAALMVAGPVPALPPTKVFAPLWPNRTDTGSLTPAPVSERTPPREPRRVGWAAAAIIAASIAGAVAFFIVRPDVVSPDTAPEVRPPPSGARAPVQRPPAPVAPMAENVVQPRRDAGDVAAKVGLDRVTIEVLDPPPGLQAVVAGKSLRVPFELPRRTEGLMVTFRAPGYRPHAVTLVADRNVALDLRMKKRDARPSRPRGSRSPSNADKSRESLDTPGQRSGMEPILDI